MGSLHVYSKVRNHVFLNYTKVTHSNYHKKVLLHGRVFCRPGSVCRLFENVCFTLDLTESLPLLSLANASKIKSECVLKIYMI